MKKIIFIVSAIFLVCTVFIIFTKNNKESSNFSIDESDITFVPESIVAYLPDGSMSCDSVYINIKHKYQIDCQKDLLLAPGTVNYSDSFLMSYGAGDNYREINIYNDNWEDPFSLLGIENNVGQIYLDDLYTFSNKIWNAVFSDDHKTIKSATELKEITFANSKAYTFVYSVESPSYLENGYRSKKNYIILEHNGKKTVISYTSDDREIEKTVNTFKFID